MPLKPHTLLSKSSEPPQELSKQTGRLISLYTSSVRLERQVVTAPALHVCLCLGLEGLIRGGWAVLTKMNFPTERCGVAADPSRAVAPAACQIGPDVRSGAFICTHWGGGAASKYLPAGGRLKKSFKVKANEKYEIHSNCWCCLF